MITRRKCSLCQKEGRFKIKYELPKFNIVQCANCCLLARDVIYSRKEIEDLYSKDYFCELQKDYFSAGISQDFKTSLRVKDFTQRLKKIIRYSKIKKGKILDVGCGTGVFLKIAKETGWETTGVEVSKFAADIARKKFGLDVLCEELEEANFAKNSFDVITGWDSIEHVEHPKDLVVEIRRILRRKGFVAFQTTMVDSLLFLIAHITYKFSFGRLSKLVEMAYPIHHSNHFSRKTLKMLLAKNGFKVVKSMNAEMFYEETSLPKISLPLLKLLGLVSKGFNRTIEVFILAKKIA